MSRRGPLVVVGDSLLDVDLDGTSDRLMPDAPAPVVEVAEQWLRPGGAGLAALLACAAGREVVLVTAVGRDEAAEALLGLLRDHLEVVALPLDGQTVCKTRVRVAGVPVLRLDRGAGRAAPAPVPASVRRALASAGAVLVSDYGRGVSALPALRDELGSLAARTAVVWDPHPRGTAPVPAAALVTPNASEAQLHADAADPHEQAVQLCRRWRAAAVVVTLGERGALLAETTLPGTTTLPLSPEHRRPGSGRVDTCGAGDQFAAAAAGVFLDGGGAREASRAGVDAASAYVLAGAAAALSTAVAPDGASRLLTASGV